MRPLFKFAEQFCAAVENEIAPNVELVEYDTHYLVKADVNRASAGGVALEIEDGVLAIMSAPAGDSRGADGLANLEASFCYTLALPRDADETSMSIAYEGSVLSLTFGRPWRTQPT